MKTPKGIIRCAIYDRVSTDNQVENGISLDAQKKALTDYAVANGYKIVGYYADEGITARKKMQNRKDLLRLLEDVKKDKIDMILVTKLDRWFRNIKDYHNTQAILEAHNCNWKTIYEDYDTSTSNGRFAINIMLSVNENECDRDSDRIKEALRYKISIGEIPTKSIVYFGYKEENKHLVIDEERQHIVKDIYETFMQNHSKHTTYQYCLKKYGDLFSFQSFKHFFTSEIYKGKYKFNEHFCPAYLTNEEWEHIQKINERNIKVYESGKRKNIYLFSGLIVCPSCGRAMTGTYIYTKYNHINHYYRCWKHRVDKSCDYKGMVSEIWLEKYLKQNILYEIGRVREKYSYAASKGPIIPFDLKKHKKELERLNSMYLKGRISEEKYDSEYQRIEALIKEQKKQEIPNEVDFERLDSIFSDDWVSIYDNLDVEHKRSFWHNAIEKIIMADKRTIKSISFAKKL